MAESTEDCYTQAQSIPDDSACTLRNKTDALKAMSMECDGISTNTSLLENLAAKYASDAEVLLLAEAEKITVPDAFTLPATLPPGFTLPGDLTFPPGVTFPDSSGVEDDAQDAVDNAANDAQNAANDAANAVGDLAAAGITPVGYLPALLVAFLVAIQMMSSQ